MGAVEALTKVLLNQPSNTLGDLFRPLSVFYLKHSAMEKIIHGIYGVASDIPRTRHGAYRIADFDKKNDAEFIPNVSSSAIIYLMRKDDINILGG